MAALRNLSMVIGAAVAALGSVLFIAWNRYVPGRRKWRRTGYELEYRTMCDQVNKETTHKVEPKRNPKRCATCDKRIQDTYAKKLCSDCINKIMKEEQPSLLTIYLDRQILVLGLDGAGKSSIIHALSTNTTRSRSAPTHGFNTAQILSQGLRIELLEVGGSQNLRTYWNQYLKKAHIMVFVVDSTDDIRLQLARHELHRLLEEAPLLPLVVLANKQDCKSALTTSDIYSELSLHRLQGVREVTLLGTSAVYDGYGSSTSLQTVRSMLEERLHKIKESEETRNHLQSNHHRTSL